ncbi:hydrogenase nickel incorporation protein HypB [uncultured Helicobacter sp.]|uniref:hydrogenase nickel incorporation protein HypB n=1 Tax=uncultured Helicobacter sp. TaxID=175537 RepID=UPI00374EA277
MINEINTNTRLESNPTLNPTSIKVAKRILSLNDQKANELRAYYKAHNLYVINLMSSPGSGKTTFLESLSAYEDFRFCVLEGDLQTNRDAERLEQKGVSAYQITTGEACHLEAVMVEQGLAELGKRCDVGSYEYLIIENVGNLVCPASYDLGAALNVVFLSTPEGDDKVLKYPSMFLCADVVVVSKADLCEVFGFRIDRVREDLARLKKDVPLFVLNSRDSASVGAIKEFFVQCKNEGFYSAHIF